MNKKLGYHNFYFVYFYFYCLIYFNDKLTRKIYSRLDSFVNNPNSYKILIKYINKNIY